MHEAEKLSLEQIEAFLNASQEIRFEGEARKQIYHWIEQVLSRQEYHQQSRQARGLLRSYLTKMTGLSRAQVTRLIARYRKSGSLQPAPYRRHRFPQRYTRADIELLATVDAAHENLSGPATRRILEREYASTASPSMSGCLRSRWRISITCGNSRAIGSAVFPTPGRGPRRWRSASDAVPIRKVSPATCG